MQKWRCKSNGVIIELKDIETPLMEQHPGYEKYNEPTTDNQPSVTKTSGRRSGKRKRVNIRDNAGGLSQ